MIHVKITGRLGNQMFFYAMLRRVQLLHGGGQAVLDFSDVYSNNKEAEGFEDSLQYFRVVDYKRAKTHQEAKQLVTYRHPTLFRFKYRLMRKLVYLLGKRKNRKNVLPAIVAVQKAFHRLGIYYTDYLTGHVDDTHIRKSLSRDMLIEGRFENPGWFAPIRQTLREEFTPKEPPRECNRELYSVIENSESVCISVRRGDYVANPAYSRIFNVCDQSYFERAVEQVKQRVSNPTFILFSDDVRWCRENISIPGCPVYFESGDDPVWEKLRLMYSCKHFIISNSTFSWWAQWLSANENKTVVCPTRWFQGNDTRWPLMEDTFIYC